MATGAVQAPSVVLRVKRKREEDPVEALSELLYCTVVLLTFKRTANYSLCEQPNPPSLFIMFILVLISCLDSDQQACKD